MLETVTSQFSEVRTVARTPSIELLAALPLSALRDISTVAGDASVTTANGEHRLQLTASGADATVSCIARMLEDW